MLSGVQQGSILGPLLFGIFINDLPLSVDHSIPYLYADDTKCLNTISSPTDIQDLQNDLNNVSLWSLRWKLFFNENKFVHIHFCSTISNNTTTYKINDLAIDRKLHHKDLGITIYYLTLPALFTYSVHVIDVQSILSSQFFSLYQTLDLVDNLFIISR